VAGMSVEGYLNSSLGDVVRVIKAYRVRNILEDRRFRELKYTIYCVVTPQNKRVSIYEFEPLDDDPTPEELEQMALEQQKREEAYMLEMYNEAKTRGYI
jgi:hypothetical protein